MPYPSILWRIFRLGSNTRGNVATIFAISMIPLMGVAGAAIDYGGALRLQATFQVTLDSAVIAGATALKNGASTTVTATTVANFVAAKFTNPDGTSPTVNTTVDATGSVSANATVSYPTTFMRIFGTDAMPMKVTSQAQFGLNAEVVIALDTTGSMGGSTGKLTAAQAAATNLVNTLYSTPGASAKIKVGLVPFNYYVNVGMSYRDAAWMTSNDDYTVPYPAYACNSYPGPYTYGAPYLYTPVVDGIPQTPYMVTPVIDWGPPVPTTCPGGNYTYTWNGGVGSRNYPLDINAETADATSKVPAVFNIGDLPQPIVRLSNDPTATLAAIAGLTANGETYIPSGLLWGWRLLSPNAPFADGAAYGSARKILILMTDGANTHSPTYPYHDGGDVALANSLMGQLCASMQNPAYKLEIYTIAFDVTDATIQSLLAGCATGGANYFNATNITAMQDAFAQIGAKLTGVRLAR